MAEFENLPGSALASLIPDWAVSIKEGCDCKDFAEKMDAWGVDGCEQRRDQIVRHLTGQSEMLIPPLRVLPFAARRWGAWKLLDRAIELASR